MTYHGRIQSGIIVLDDAPSLPEGAEVRVDVVPTPEKEATLGERLMKYAGQAKGLPSDLARNHDHYLHGVQKQ
jgi:hypothetical protein